jgi:preprotein translocase subunit SecG
MLFSFLLVLQTIVAASMVGVILLQRSEGGGLGVGGSPSGLMSARGAADFLTRATAILAFLFVTLSIILAGLATIERAPTTIDQSLAPPPASAPPVTPGVGTAPGQTPPAADPLAGAAQQSAGQPATNQAAPAPAPKQ